MVHKDVYIEFIKLQKRGPNWMYTLIYELVHWTYNLWKRYEYEMERVNGFGGVEL
jgi:hypothetical protein